MESMSLAQARRTALAAQGLHRRRPVGAHGRDRATMRDLQRVVDTLGVLQIDSVNVLARAHLVPLYSRIGPYPTALLDRASGTPPRRVLEAWGHEASYVSPEVYRLLAWRRAQVDGAWGSIRRVAVEHPRVVADVRSLVAEHGPVTASALHALLDAEHDAAHAPADKDWGWNWSLAKTALEHLFYVGEVAAARRNGSFERCYDLAERVVPAEALAPVGDADAVRGLLEIGARAHGVGTLRCFRDYFRLRGPLVPTALAELVEGGVLRPVTVRGWDAPTYLHRDATFPRIANARTLLSPFDPLVFERTRFEQLFGVRYRIEIYVPAPQRVHGYYVLPFLEGDRISARVDLKADRAAGVLRVLAAHDEPDTGEATPQALAAELAELAGWLGLSAIDVRPRGGLAPDLSRAVGEVYA
ncbi:hypothetical protein GCM10025865_22110 [Paraoerskovia sediminicola]|uniref:Winged helix-turn-helix domain-containing protein n=1 Tax=Paraoerskovia sediminicola TaxID=1138587 RepID=A0ABN6XDG2_9CELL|nr:crosslink repair DNA glycosylase YcaQ family protein [Paraoerskovia sediminicola]BDZ42912.1 hypothetical protein GCM10025865_22110 [Paraoerskovia sediminicola]